MARSNDLREEWRNFYFLITGEVRNMEKSFRGNYNKEFHLVEFASGGQHEKHTVQHGTLKSSEITMSRAPRYLKDHGVEVFCTFPACLSDKNSTRTKRSAERWWKDGIWIAHSSESWIGIPLTGINVCLHFSLGDRGGTVVKVL